MLRQNHFILEGQRHVALPKVLLSLRFLGNWIVELLDALSLLETPELQKPVCAYTDEVFGVGGDADVPDPLSVSVKHIFQVDFQVLDFEHFDGLVCRRGDQVLLVFGDFHVQNVVVVHLLNVRLGLDVGLAQLESPQLSVRASHCEERGIAGKGKRPDSHSFDDTQTGLRGLFSQVKDLDESI